MKFTTEQLNEMRRERLIADMKEFSSDKFEVKSDRETKKSLFAHHLKRVMQMKQEEK